MIGLLGRVRSRRRAERGGGQTIGAEARKTESAEGDGWAFSIVLRHLLVEPLLLIKRSSSDSTLTCASLFRYGQIFLLLPCSGSLVPWRQTLIHGRKRGSGDGSGWRWDCSKLGANKVVIDRTPFRGNNPNDTTLSDAITTRDSSGVSI